MLAAAMPVISREGIRGIIRPEAWLTSEAEAQILVTFQNGLEQLIPTAALEPRLDGGYWVDLSSEQLHAIRGDMESSRVATPDPVSAWTIPVLQEEATLRIERTAVAKVRIHKTVHREEVSVREPTYDEDVTVERHSVNRVVEAPVPVRYEGDTMIIPVMEETLVVQKQYIPKEEIHVTTTRRPIDLPQTYTLRHEEVTVERIPLTPDPSVDGPINSPQGKTP
jgi:stress response protein YsnF